MNKQEYYNSLTKEYYIDLLNGGEISSKLNSIIVDGLFHPFLTKLFNIFQLEHSMQYFHIILEHIPVGVLTRYNEFRLIFKINETYTSWFYHRCADRLNQGVKNMVRLFKDTKYSDMLYHITIFKLNPDLKFKYLNITSDRQVRKLEYNHYIIPHMLRDVDLGRHVLNTILNKSLKTNKEIFEQYVRILTSRKMKYDANLTDVYQPNNYVQVRDRRIIVSNNNRYTRVTIYCTVVQKNRIIKLTRTTSVSNYLFNKEINMERDVLNLIGGVVRYRIDEVRELYTSFNEEIEKITLHHNMQYAVILSRLGEDGCIKRDIEYNSTEFDRDFILSCIPRYVNNPIQKDVK